MTFTSNNPNFFRFVGNISSTELQGTTILNLKLCMEGIQFSRHYDRGRQIMNSCVISFMVYKGLHCMRLNYPSSGIKTLCVNYPLVYFIHASTNVFIIKHHVINACRREQLFISNTIELASLKYTTLVMIYN